LSFKHGGSLAGDQCKSFRGGIFLQGRKMRAARGGIARGDFRLREREPGDVPWERLRVSPVTG